MENRIQKFPLNFFAVRFHFAVPGPWPRCCYYWSVVQRREAKAELCHALIWDLPAVMLQLLHLVLLGAWYLLVLGCFGVMHAVKLPEMPEGPRYCLYWRKDHSCLLTLHWVSWRDQRNLCLMFWTMTWGPHFRRCQSAIAKHCSNLSEGHRSVRCQEPWFICCETWPLA